MDSLVPTLRRYFESQWEVSPHRPQDSHICGDALSNCLDRDLKGLCEDVFVKRIYKDKKDARNYFIEEGFEVFLPTMLVMGSRMVADQDLQFSSGYRYLRALFTGLALEPNYTMFYLSQRYDHYDPSINKIMEEFRQRYGGRDPSGMTLEQISQAAQEMLKKLGSS
jgi:hypothetical protein